MWNSASEILRCAVELTGRNSVSPSMIPNTTESKKSFKRSSLKFGSWHLALSIWSSGFRDNRGRLNAECQMLTAECQMLTAVLLLLRIPVGWNPLLNQIQQAFGARSPIALRILACDLLRQGDGLAFRLVGLFPLIFGFVDLNQRRPARSSIVERFGCRRRLRMFGRVFLVGLCFFFRTLRRPLPISAEFI